jgi:riboflavin biosynthesis pyrimidine reductase
MKQLQSIGMNSILLEGGGTLNWNMLSQGLVDEVRVAISPQIVGGESAVTLAEGRGANGLGNTVKLRFLKSKWYGPDLVLYYKVLA